MLAQSQPCSRTRERKDEEASGDEKNLRIAMRLVVSAGAERRLLHLDAAQILQDVAHVGVTIAQFAGPCSPP